MHKYLSDYMKQMNRLLEENRSFTETDLQRHLDKIGFMQHERLIHFLVTMLFAIVLFLVLGAFLMTEAMFLLPLLGSWYCWCPIFFTITFWKIRYRRCM